MPPGYWLGTITNYVATYLERGKLSPLFIPLRNRIGLDLIRARQGTNMVAKFTVAC